jgi:hypothetical protein
MTTFPGNPPKHLLGLKQAEDRLNPNIKAKIDEVIQYGWDVWCRDYKPKHPILSARTRAGVIFDEIVHKVAEVFAGVPDVVFKRCKGNWLLYIGTDIVFRFKKLRPDRRYTNVKTHQQTLFQLQIELPGMEKGTLLQAGYVLDDLQTSLVRKVITCQFGKNVLWSIDLDERANAPIVQMPLDPTPEPRRGERFEPKPEVAAKQEKQKKKKKEG